MLWLWGITVVGREGVRVSRLRALGRTVVAWLPILAAGAIVVGHSMPPAREALVTSAAVSLWMAGAIYAIARPERGLQDLIANTRVVPH